MGAQFPADRIADPLNRAWSNLKDWKHQHPARRSDGISARCSLASHDEPYGGNQWNGNYAPRHRDAANWRAGPLSTPSPQGAILYRLGPHSGAFMWLVGLCEKESTMKFVLLCAALSFVVWTAPARAEELCAKPRSPTAAEQSNRQPLL